MTTDAFVSGRYLVISQERVAGFDRREDAMREAADWADQLGAWIHVVRRSDGRADSVTIVSPVAGTPTGGPTAPRT